MPSELKPCPLCGGEAEIWRAVPADAPRPARKAWIACMDRCCAFVTQEKTTDAEAIAAWNTRATEHLPAREVTEAASHMQALLDVMDEDDGMEGYPDDESVGWRNGEDLPMTFGHLRRARESVSALTAALGQESE